MNTTVEELKEVLLEMKELFQSDDKKKELAYKCLNKLCTHKEGDSTFWYKSDGWGKCTVYTIYGMFYYEKQIVFNRPRVIKNVYIKNGIEVLDEIRFSRYDKNGKCIKSYYTNKELKRRCKMNGIKGYSKLDKLGLCKALMSI